MAANTDSQRFSSNIAGFAASLRDAVLVEARARCSKPAVSTWAQMLHRPKLANGLGSTRFTPVDLLQQWWYPLSLCLQCVSSVNCGRAVIAVEYRQRLVDLAGR